LRSPGNGLSWKTVLAELIGWQKVFQDFRCCGRPRKKSMGGRGVVSLAWERVKGGKFPLIIRSSLREESARRKESEEEVEKRRSNIVSLRPPRRPHALDFHRLDCTTKGEEMKKEWAEPGTEAYQRRETFRSREQDFGPVSLAGAKRSGRKR